MEVASDPAREAVASRADPATFLRRPATSTRNDRLAPTEPRLKAPRDRRNPTELHRNKADSVRRPRNRSADRLKASARAAPHLRKAIPLARRKVSDQLHRNRTALRLKDSDRAVREAWEARKDTRRADHRKASAPVPVPVPLLLNPTDLRHNRTAPRLSRSLLRNSNTELRRVHRPAVPAAPAATPRSHNRLTEHHRANRRASHHQARATASPQVN